ncbi:MAG: HAD family hydrolase [Alphaproteobacteria bacterium]|nr:MAG: HAD family hydrolase [Alphaproteobacteria bacterium]
MVEMVIFDCDGVIVDSEIVVNRSNAAVKTELGYPITMEEHIRVFCGQGPDSPVTKEAWAKLPDNYPSIAYERSLVHLEDELEPILNIKQVLEGLEVPFCMASNSALKKIDFMLNKTEIMPLFEGRIFSSEMVPRGKPEPDVYLHAAETMGVDPARCLVVEDSIPGVTAGVAAGMTVLGFTGGSHHAHMDVKDLLLELGARELFDDMTKLPQLIAHYRQKQA